MFKLINPNHLFRIFAVKDLSKIAAFRTCHTGNTDNVSAAIEAVKLEKTEDPDMFISDIESPFKRKKCICIICKYSIPLDYKNPKLLSQFVSPYTGFLYDKHITGLCDAQQKRLEAAIGRSQGAGYMAFRVKTAKYLKDPKLFDPFSPSRPNPY